MIKFTFTKFWNFYNLLNLLKYLLDWYLIAKKLIAHLINFDEITFFALISFEDIIVSFNI